MTTSPEAARVLANGEAADLPGRITVIHVRVSNYPGGIETTLFGWLRAMDHERFKARVFFFEESNRSHERSLRLFRERGYAVELLPWSPFKNLPGAVRRLMAAIREQPNVVLHSHDTRADLVAIIAARRCRVPLVISNHAWHAVGFKRWLLEAVRARLMPWADLIINVSEDTHLETIRRGVAREKSVTVYSGIDLEDFRHPPPRDHAREELGLPLEAFVVGHVARMWPEKAQHTLIEAASELAADHPEAVFLIVGDGPLEESLRAQARDLGVDGMVRFVGFRKDLVKVMATFDVFALPSTAEGTPMVIYSAMAMGQPIIASAAAGVAEVLEDDSSAILIPPAGTEALIAAIRRLMADPKTASRLGSRAREVVEDRYSVEQAVRTLEKIYVDLRAGCRPQDGG